MIHLKLAQKSDLEQIAIMAKEIWNAHYVGIVGQEQVDYMLNKFYGSDSLTHQFLIEQHQFYFINDQAVTIGFLSVSCGENRNCFIHKFYIFNKYTCKGAGTKTVDALLELINPKTLKLTVNRKNFKSINFYFKNGFKIMDVQDFDIGNSYFMNDFIMQKEIAK